MIETRTPARLHFGLLAINRGPGRQFGGAGLMIRRPEVVLRVRHAESWSAEGPLADRALDFGKRFTDRAVEAGMLAQARPARIEVARVPRPHTGLGSGTQVAMAVASALTALHGIDNASPETLAVLVGRGKRSAIGVHGFARGGFLVDGGKRRDALQSPALSPLLLRLDFPEPWRFVLIRPRRLEGLAGERETAAFGEMPDVPDAVTDAMCRLVLLGLVPAILEKDLPALGEALYELQRLAGGCFASAQGGIYADPSLEDIVDFARAWNGGEIRGVGQSSWGPTLYALAPDEDTANRLATDIERRFGLSLPGEVIVTQADNRGATTRRTNANAPV